MRILFTGASSFTGLWFVSELVHAGHEVVATFSASEGAYSGVRALRVQKLQDLSRRVFDCSFGSEAFLDLISDYDSWDLLCHHAAHVRDYKSPDFDFAGALQANTQRLPDVLSNLAERRCGRVCLTGSVFEGGEGAGSQGVPAFSPYGLSKELTHRAFAYYCHKANMDLAKFVISNPFGPFEDPRFTAYLISTWAQGRMAEVRTPDYVRDNIHVSLLAAAYRQFIDGFGARQGAVTLNPSGYIESQGRFAERFAAAMRSRLGWDCKVALLDQRSFDEPRVRINIDPASAMVPDWSEESAWDELAEYYRASITKPNSRA